MRVGTEDVALEHDVAAFRDEVAALLGPVLGGRVDLAAAGSVAPGLARRTRTLRDALLKRHADRLDPVRLDQELREKQLVLVLGGGGGTGYVYLGAFALLEELGIVPRLIAGTSMGGILGLFRARQSRFDGGEIAAVVRGLSFRRLFRVLHTDSRYGLPAALRLYLRAAVGKYFTTPAGEPYTFRDLPIPMLITLTGIRRGMLPRPLEHYERLLDVRTLALRPWLVRAKIEEVVLSIAELLGRPQVLTTVHAGYEAWTEELDVLDAAGFSSAVPGVIHYDVTRDDERIHALLGRLCAEKEIFRLIDGGVTDNVPARAAWRYVQSGKLGSRNAVVLALDAFSPRLTTPIWLPMQRIAAENVRLSTRYAHVVRSFQRTLSPVELVPSVETVLRTVERGKAELASEAPLLAKLASKLPPLEEVAARP